MDREKVIYTLEEAKTLCSSGKMSLRDAAVQCGVSETKLYREIRSDEEAYAEYKATHSIRMKLKSQFPNKARNARRVQKKSELAKENYFKKLMQKYHSTSIAEKIRKAKKWGCRMVGILQCAGRIYLEA